MAHHLDDGHGTDQEYNQFKYFCSAIFKCVMHYLGICPKGHDHPHDGTSEYGNPAFIDTQWVLKGNGQDASEKYNEYDNR